MSILKSKSLTPRWFMVPTISSTLGELRSFRLVASLSVQPMSKQKSPLPTWRQSLLTPALYSVRRLMLHLNSASTSVSSSSPQKLATLLLRWRAKLILTTPFCALRPCTMSILHLLFCLPMLKTMAKKTKDLLQHIWNELTNASRRIKKKTSMLWSSAMNWCLTSRDWLLSRLMKFAEWEKLFLTALTLEVSSPRHSL